MKIRKSLLIGIIIAILLLGGLLLALYLNQRQQEIRQRAAEPTPTSAFGQSAKFDGQTTALTTPANVTLSQPFTIEGWIKPMTQSQESEVGEIIASTNVPIDQTSCTDTFQLFTGISSSTSTNPNTYNVELRINPGPNYRELSSGTYTQSVGKWSHIAVTVDETNTVQLFLNGKKVDQQTLAQPFCSNAEIVLGGAYSEAENGQFKYFSSFNGFIDELRYSTAVRYTENFIPPTSPFTFDSQTKALVHFDGALTEEGSNINAVNKGGTDVTFDSGAVPTDAVTPVCKPNTSTCEWDPVGTAVSYHYIITESGNATPIAEGDVNAPTTSVTFTSEANKTYTCEVTATNACGTGAKGSATATCSVPTPTPLPSDTPTPTETPIPSSTPTNTPTPTATPTNTPTPTKPPAPTATPTNTPTPTTPIATNTPRPTATPTNTPTPTIPGQPTYTPTPTLASPGSTAQTITIAGAVILTILGAIILFVL